MDYKKTIETSFKTYLKDNQLELHDVVMEKEDGINFLRVFLKGDDMTMDKMAEAGRFLNKSFDDHDPIEGEYILDVGSIGTDQVVENIKDALGKFVIVTLLDTRVIKGRVQNDDDGGYVVVEDIKGRIKRHPIHEVDVVQIKIEAKA